MTNQTTPRPFGILAEKYCHVQLPLQALQSAAGWYIGTYCTSGELFGPVSRESAEYFSSENSAKTALANDQWTQREHP